MPQPGKPICMASTQLSLITLAWPLAAKPNCFLSETQTEGVGGFLWGGPKDLG